MIDENPQRITALHATHIINTGTAAMNIPMSDTIIVAIEININGVSIAIAAINIMTTNKHIITTHVTSGNGMVAKKIIIAVIIINTISIVNITHAIGIPTTTIRQIIPAKHAINTANDIIAIVNTPLKHMKQHNPIRKTTHIPAIGIEHIANRGHTTVNAQKSNINGVYIAIIIDITHSIK